jgi:hypothetical protein
MDRPIEGGERVGVWRRVAVVVVVLVVLVIILLDSFFVLVVVIVILLNGLAWSSLFYLGVLWLTTHCRGWFTCVLLWRF